MSVSQNIQNFLALDWGSVNIGVALAHAETGVALAYMTLRNDKAFFKKLGDVIKMENIGTIIIGVPAYIHHETKAEGERLGRCINKEFSVCVEYQNEMFTTKMAQANLMERGEKNVGKHDDAESARLILQDWLDKR